MSEKENIEIIEFVKAILWAFFFITAGGCVGFGIYFTLHEIFHVNFLGSILLSSGLFFILLLIYFQIIGRKEIEMRKKMGMLKDSDDEIQFPTRSRHISQNIKDKVWNRDGGKCVECGSNENLEFDHIIPFSKGGANTYRNIQLLCEFCNRNKSAKLG